MDKIKIRVNLIVTFTDGFTGTETLKGSMAVRTHNGIYGLRKENNCFVFAQCPRGRYRIQVEASDYLPCSFDVKMDDTIQQMHLTLMPSPWYTFGGSVTKLFGIVKKDVKAYAAFFPESSRLRVIGSCQKGSRQVKLFSYDKTQWSTQRLCFRHGTQHQICTVTQTSADAMTYELGQPAAFAITPQCVVGFCYAAVPMDETGAYFLAVKGRYDRAVIILGESVTEIALQEPEARFDMI